MKSHKHMYRMQQKQFIVWWKIGLMLGMHINIPYVIRTRKRNFLHFYLLLRDHGNSSKVLIYLTLISFFLNLYALARVCLWGTIKRTNFGTVCLREDNLTFSRLAANFSEMITIFRGRNLKIQHPLTSMALKTATPNIIKTVPNKCISSKYWWQAWVAGLAYCRLRSHLN